MQKVLTKTALICAALAMMGSASFAGNNDRAGSAGATELLINPWARTSGFGGANSASVRGVEAMYLNIAGTAFTRKTEMVFTRTNWLVGTDININSFGLSQKVGEAGAFGLAVMSMDFGEIEITTPEMPEGGLGTFSPQYINVNASYSRKFSNRIYGGLNTKIISEAISDLRAFGFALDAGVQYVTGADEQIKFGVAIKNVGPAMTFQGDGLSFRGKVEADKEYDVAVEQRAASFELPSLLNIGVAYDFKLSEEDSTGISDHRLTAAGTFTSNSFSKDQIRIGVEYGFKKYFMARLGYVYEQGLWDQYWWYKTRFPEKTRSTAFTGPTAGFSVDIPFSENGASFGFDYSYRSTNPFQGVHTFGARVTL